MKEPDHGRQRGFRQVIDDFLKDRLEQRLKNQNDPQKREQLIHDHRAENWIGKAAKDAGTIKVATHVAKAGHSSASGTDFYCPPGTLPAHSYIGSHLLASSFSKDTAVRTAAAFGADSFLRLEYEGRTFLDYIFEDDPDLLAALNEDKTRAQAWCDAFTSVTRTPDTPASHTLLKQLYWLSGENPLDNDDFHLLSPVFASSLAHEVYLRIRDDRFGETIKAIREAKRKGDYHESEERLYPNLAEQKLTVSQHQNVSRLNGNRRGINYLLASLPPSWQSQNLQPPYGIDSVFERFFRQRPVISLVSTLREFLESDPVPTMRTRQRRDHLLNQIISELFQYEAQLHTLEPGWSRDTRCRLPPSEIRWLDPRRAAHDTEIDPEGALDDWQAQICHRFSSSLNALLGSRLPMGDIEHAFWMDMFDDASREQERRRSHTVYPATLNSAEGAAHD